MKLFRPTMVLVCILAAVFIGACLKYGEGVKSDAGQRTIKDDLGNVVVLPAKVTKAVSLAPNITEIVFAVGAGDRLVGVTTFCNYPEEAKSVRKVGDTLKPNIESIVALKPQIVFVSTASQLESFSKLLKEQGIEVFVTNPDSVESVFEGITKIGEVMGQSEEASALISRIKTRLRAAGKDAKDSERTNKAFVQIDKTLYTIGKGSFISDALSRIGYESVTDDIDNPYPKISKERARTLAPELIIISASVGNDAPNEVFATSPAVKTGRVYKIDADILSRPGPRFVDALEDLVKQEKAWDPVGNSK